MSNPAQDVVMVSTVSGNRCEIDLTPDYWAENLTSPVKFYQAIKSVMAGSNEILFLEIGPHSQLAGPIRQTCADSQIACKYIPTMLREVDCEETLLTTFGFLWQQCIFVDLSVIFPAGKVLTDLPLYSWNCGASYWYENRVSTDWRFRQFGHHCLLGQRIPETSTLEPAWRYMLDLEDVPWPADHKVRDDIVFPLAGYISMAGEAIRQISSLESGYSARHIVVPTALVLQQTMPVELLTSLKKRQLTDSVDSEYWDITVSSFTGQIWIKHCSGSVKTVMHRPKAMAESASSRRISSSKWYQIMADVGLKYGPEFRGIKKLEASTTENRATGEIQARFAKSFLFHPATMDACFQLVIAAAAKGLGRNLAQLLVPTLLEEIVQINRTIDVILAF